MIKQTDLEYIYNFLNLNYKYKNFIESVEERIIERLNNDFGEKDVFTLGDSFSSGDDYQLSKIFFGKYINFKKLPYNNCLYIGLIQNMASCFNKKAPEKKSKEEEQCFLGVEIKDKYMKHNLNFVQDTDHWNAFGLDLDSLDSPAKFVENVVNKIKEIFYKDFQIL